VDITLTIKLFVAFTVIWSVRAELDSSRLSTKFCEAHDGSVEVTEFRNPNILVGTFLKRQLSG
jgi:hypothetical protein